VLKVGGQRLYATKGYDECHQVEERAECTDLGHDDDLVSWQTMLFDGFSKNHLRHTMRVNLRINRLVSYLWTPTSDEG